MTGYLAPFVATFAAVFLLTRIASPDSVWRQRLPSLGFMLAAIIKPRKNEKHDIPLGANRRLDFRR